VEADVDPFGNATAPAVAESAAAPTRTEAMEDDLMYTIMAYREFKSTFEFVALYG
jgi:hypothetical protein